MSNQYCSQLEKSGQLLSATIALILAVLFIYQFCSFICKAVLDNGEEQRICLCSLPFFITLAASLLTEMSRTHIGEYYTVDEKNS